MKAHISTTHSVKLLVLVLLLTISFPFSSRAATDMDALLPPLSCGSGWQIEGKAVLYDRDSLSDRINGEAELYMPYGFDRMAAARYAPNKGTGSGIDVEVYRMASLLDAFGMFANYRQKDGRTLSIGAGSNQTGSQLYFYQDRFFVHIQTTGADAADADTLADCGRSVASLLTGNQNKPSELAVFDRREVLKGTERYLPQSLLGYDFLNRGLMADAVVDGETVQIFRLLGTTAESASAAFAGYRSQLPQGVLEDGGSGATFLEGVDPLYGPVMVMRKGNCLAGALKFKGKKGVRALLESVCR